MKATRKGNARTGTGIVKIIGEEIKSGRKIVDLSRKTSKHKREIGRAGKSKSDRRNRVNAISQRAQEESNSTRMSIDRDSNSLRTIS